MSTEEIEDKRFDSMIDPGIVGIVERLASLPFIASVLGSCCSGHPKDSYSKKNVTAKAGYLYIKYKGFNILHPNNYIDARRFHRSLREICVEADKWYGFIGANIRSFSSSTETFDIPSQSPPTPVYKIMEFRDLRYFGGEYDLRIESLVLPRESCTALDIATAFCAVWKEVSELIKGFERDPISEQLNLEYFGCRSNYGVLEATCRQFQTYVDNKYLITQQSLLQK